MVRWAEAQPLEYTGGRGQRKEDKVLEEATSIEAATKEGGETHRSETSSIGTFGRGGAGGLWLLATKKDKDMVRKTNLKEGSTAPLNYRHPQPLGEKRRNP